MRRCATRGTPSRRSRRGALWAGLRQVCPPGWAERSGPRLGDYRRPLAAAAREALAAQIGADGRQLLQAAYAPDAPAWLREVPAVEALRHAP